MATLSVIYPRAADTRFDVDYYEKIHLPLVARRWGDAGLTGGEALIGTGAPDGSESPFFAIGIIHFSSAAELQAAMGGEHAPEIIGDIANFTDVQPILQINERIAPAA